MEGLVIGSIAYKEKSKIVYLYTKQGKVSVNVSKAFMKSGFTTTLNVVDFQTTDKQYKSLIEYTLVKSFYSLNEDIHKIQCIMVILDLINKLEEDANHTRIYPFLIKCLSILEACRNYKFILSLFLLKMLSVFGVKPVLNQCLICGEKKIVNFSIYQGGALCDNCSSYNEGNYNLYLDYKKLYFDQTYDEKKFLDVDFDNLLKSIYDYYYEHLNMRLKNYKI